MTIGEGRYGEEIGLKDCRHRYVWHVCIDCGKGRLVKLYKNIPRSARCKKCSCKINSPYKIGRQLSSERRTEISKQVSGEGNPMFRKHHSESAKHKMRQSKIALFKKLGDKWWTKHPRPDIAGQNNPNYQGGQPQICDNCGGVIRWRRPYRIKKQKHHFCNMKCLGEWRSRSSEFLSLIMLAAQRRPNKSELKLNAILKSLLLPYKYVGDGQFIVGGKCPDFMNVNGQKKLIELYGDFWHKGQDPQERIDYFSQYGFKTLVIWERELSDLETLKGKLRHFNTPREFYVAKILGLS